MTQNPGSEVVIVGAARTAFGSFLGALSGTPAPRLGAAAIEAALKRAGVEPAQVNEVIMGNVLTAGEGQAPARQASIYAGIPNSVPCLTVNKVCGSGMKAVMLAAQSIRLGETQVAVAGGMENMSLAPHLLLGARQGFKMGNQNMVDSMVTDGLWDPYNNQHMGNCAELCARENHFSREQQDGYAIESFKRAQEAQKSGKFHGEIAPVKLKGPRGDETLFEEDEGPGKVKFDKIPTLKPVFDKSGSVTAANASTINDGAAALVLMSADKAKAMGVKPLARIVSTGTHAQAPEWFTTAPAGAMKAALKKAGWTPEQVDLWEVNEAFAVVALAAQKELNIPADRYNVWG
ncbi:MAG TPA: thiolase family protein, partial [Bdellovibrionota bacterium]|nr:thiolase family protein [Bdellovibrionota bacterium]